MGWQLDWKTTSCNEKKKKSSSQKQNNIFELQRIHWIQKRLLFILHFRRNMWKNICGAAKILKASNIQSYKNYLRWVLGFRKLRSSKKVETIASCSYFASCIMKKKFMEQRNSLFSPYFHYGIIFCCAELCEWVFNFKFYWNIWIFLNIKGNAQFVQNVTYEPSIDFKQNH